MLDDQQRRKLSALLQREDLEDLSPLKSLANAEEIHQFVLNYNWDDGFESVIEILNHPHCDLGTGLLAYWLSGPFSCQFRSRDECPNSERQVFDIFLQLEKRLCEGSFATELFRVDPRNLLETGDDWVGMALPRTPPAQLTRPTPGKPTSLDTLEYPLSEQEQLEIDRLDDDEALRSLKMQADNDPAFRDNLEAFERYYKAKYR